ncbi:MAG: dihydropteroate synthase [Okeania sp. SIO2B3]|nr:dihydropteroate synthase [Okeania sp. SIO2B3]
MLTLADICEVYDKHQDDYNTQVEEFTIGNKKFNFNSQTALLGIINLSTDSWHNHAICYTPEQAIERGKVLTAQGADIIDIGAESSVPKTQRVDEFKQKSSLLPVIEALTQEGVLTSVETYYPELARICLKAGAKVVNFTGTENSEEMYRAVADFDAAIIICYLQEKNVRDVKDFDYTLANDPIDLVYDYFGKEIEKATKLGVKKIFVDPAVALLGPRKEGLYASTQIKYQIRSLLNAFRLRKLGFPVLHTLFTAKEIFGEELRSGQVFTSVFAALGKNDMLRTHEVSKVKAVLECMSLF